MYRREVEAMEGELRGIRSVLPNAADAIYMIEMADAIFESINTRRTVQVR
jgi:predicted dehydrogenase